MLGEYLGVEKDQNQPGGWEIARSRPVDMSCGGVTKIDGKNDDYLNSIWLMGVMEKKWDKGFYILIFQN